MKSLLKDLFSRHCLVIFLALALISGCDSSADLTAQQHVDKAKAFIEKNDLNAATIELKNALQKDANMPEARWILGKTYLELGNGIAAEKEFTRAQSLGFTHPDFQRLNLQSQLLQREYKTVIERINAITESERSAGILVVQGNAYLGVGDTNSALNNFLKAQNLDSTNVDALSGLTRVAFINGQMEQADKYIEEAMALEPDNVEVWNLKGRSALFKNDPVAAEKAFSHAAKLAEHNLTAQFGLTRALLAQEKIEEAMVPIKAVESRFAKHPVTRYFRAYIALQNNEVEKAKDYLRTALQVQPNHPESLFMMSRILYGEGKLDQANEHITPYLQENPDNLAAIKLKSAILVNLNQPGKAIEMLEKTVAGNPDDPRLHALLGTTYVRAGNPERGIEILEEALAMAGGNAAELKTQLAIARLSAGATDMAISDLESAIELEPDFVNADILLILSHMRAGEYEKAATAAGNFAKKAPDNPMPFNLMGAAYMGMNEPGKAREKFNQALKLNPDYIPALSNLATLELREGQNEAAETRFLKILAIDPDNTKALVQMARLEAKRGNNDRIVDYLQRARASSDSAVEPRVLLGRYYLQTGQSARLFEVTSEAYELAPEAPDVLLLHGQALRLTGDIPASLNILGKLVDMLPKNPNANFQLGMTRLQAGDLEGAESAFNKTLELEPGHGGALNAAAKLALSQGNTDAAREYSARLKEIHPESADSHALEGDILLSENNPRAAVAEYEKAMEFADSNLLLTRLTEAYQQSGETDKAILAMDKWLNKNPGDVRINLLLARTYQEGNKLKEAMDIYEKILSGPDPDNIIALNNLAWLSIEEDLDYAQELASKANELTPDHPEILDTLGWILVKQGKTERGLVHLRAANAANPDSPQIQYHIAVALAEAGDNQQARETLARLLESDVKFSEREKAESLYNSLK